ncbi:hypothetical protein T4B_13344 [Trichinella pseudospiralis]|uniref:Uncharacterized protein n=2 Tax=Trichinella pseudospiralis TaxID=6337 RepID=A0A0V1E8W4_TRIPS|nr:hypothetical protein T4A_8796 [Trichinella pseudospiralis]KRY88420.1 hypothetical protein T4D_1042 [Trichinella pseudospiralis]KRZ29844.1 hypothetical protein T4B_13344 [Trichinella pseudospiralis]KRZ38575.1 hypothetical protein T4C_3839 [Trichinella pseudospiralis]
MLLYLSDIRPAVLNNWFLKVLIIHSFVALPVSMKTSQKFHMPTYMHYICSSPFLFYNNKTLTVTSTD